MKNKNLNEEINRIKSLFTEERLYGNLCEQDFDFNWGSNASPSGKPSMVSGDKTVQVGSHDSLCNDKHKEYCKNEDLIATNVTQLGKDWDIEEGSVTVFNNNYLTLGKGHWDYKEYTKCACRKGKVENDKFIENKTPIITAITDPQYEKLLRGEITNDEYSNYLAKMRSIENKEFRSLDRFSYEGSDFWNYHTLFDILSIASFILIPPPAGVGISMFIESLSAIGYFKEGEWISGGLTVALGIMFPGFATLRNTLIKRGLSKELDELLEWISKNKNPSTDDLIEQTKKIFGSKYEKNKKHIDEVLEIINNNPKLNKLTTNKEMLSKILRQEKHLKNFLDNEDLLKKYMRKNGDDVIKSFVAYLKDLSLIEFKTGVKFYFGLIGLVKIWESIYGEVNNEFGVEPKELFKEYDLNGIKYIVICDMERCWWATTDCKEITDNLITTSLDNKFNIGEGEKSAFEISRGLLILLEEEYKKLKNEFCNKKVKEIRIDGDPTNWMKY